MATEAHVLTAVQPAPVHLMAAASYPLASTSLTAATSTTLGGESRDKHYASNHPFDETADFKGCEDAPSNRSRFTAENMPPVAAFRPRPARLAAHADASATTPHVITANPFPRLPNGSASIAGGGKPSDLLAPGEGAEHEDHEESPLDELRRGSEAVASFRAQSAGGGDAAARSASSSSASSGAAAGEHEPQSHQHHTRFDSSPRTAAEDAPAGVAGALHVHDSFTYGWMLRAMDDDAA